MVKDGGIKGLKLDEAGKLKKSNDPSKPKEQAPASVFKRQSTISKTPGANKKQTQIEELKKSEINAKKLNIINYRNITEEDIEDDLNADDYFSQKYNKMSEDLEQKRSLKRNLRLNSLQIQEL